MHIVSLTIIVLKYTYIRRPCSSTHRFHLQVLTHVIPVDFKSDLRAWSSGVEWGRSAE